MAGEGLIALFGGPAGAGKSTLARAWCATRERAAHVQLDAVRSLIVQGLADPQAEGDLQARQYATSVAATCALARALATDGCDVAVDDVLDPDAFARWWRPALEGAVWRLVVVRPSLEATLARSAGRAKRVQERHTRAQHARSGRWPAEVRVDTTELDVEASLALVAARLG
jgi:chloramphenicol 3-O-phosphotransferase